MAREQNLVLRTSPITGFKFLLTFTTGLLNEKESTLAQLAAFLNNSCGSAISPQAVDQRINGKAKDFLKECFIKSLKLSTGKIEMKSEFMKMFSHIFIIDSTNFSLHPSLSEVFKGNGGSASKSSIRIQFMYDFITGRMYVHIGDVKLADASSYYKIIEDRSIELNGTALFLADLGYFKVDSFVLIDKASNNFVSRLKSKVQIYDESNRLIDAPKLFNKRQDVDIAVKIGKLKCRLIGRKLPDDIVNKRLRNANNEAKRRGKTVSEEQKLLLKYGLYITNMKCPLTFDDVFTLYRLRWQIELIFKTWKSILGMHKIRTAKENRVMCEVYGKLIVAALTSHFSYRLKIEFNIVLSFHKLLQYIKAIAVNWTLAIIAGTDRHMGFLNNLSAQIIRFCRKNKQKNKPAIEELLENLGITENNRLTP